MYFQVRSCLRAVHVALMKKKHMPSNCIDESCLRGTCRLIVLMKERHMEIVLMPSNCIDEREAHGDCIDAV
jgi:hypothetical protein